MPPVAPSAHPASLPPPTATPSGFGAAIQAGLTRPSGPSGPSRPGITRFATLLSLALALFAGLPTPAAAAPLITEFMASNSTTLADEDRAFPDWIELYNPDATAVNLSGWFLTDNATDKKKWTFPAVTLAPQAYLVVFTSGKDRRDPAKPLHTNFSLNADGEYLALVRPDGVTATTEFAPTFPAQRTDVSYGTLSPTTAGVGAVGFLVTPTPGTRNSAGLQAALTETVVFSRAAGPFSTPFTLTLSGAAAGQDIRYVLVAPSATGTAAPDPTATSTKYTGPLTIDSSVFVKAAVFTADASNRGTASRTHYVKIGGTTATDLVNFSSNLPVLLLDNHGAGPLKKDLVDHEGWLYRYPAKSPAAPALAGPPDVSVPVTLTVRGSSSAGFPKKSYSLELGSPTGGKSALPLVGSVASKKWALIGPWYFDQTAIKNSFLYALSNRLGHWAPGTQPVEVFFHTGGELGAVDYVGLYLLTERIEIDAQKIDLKDLATGPTADVTGGYIIKLDSPDPDEFSFSTSRDVPGGNSAIVVASAKADELSAAHRTYLTTYFQQMEDTLVADFQGAFATRNYLDYIDRASWLDFHLLNVFSSNFDAFERSAYYSKDRGGKLVAGPLWDFDRAFGAATYYATVPWDRWFVEGGVNFWQTGWWGWLTRDPEFMQDWVDRWQSLRQGLLANTNLLALADSLSTAIGPAALARDAARWPQTTPEYTAGLTGGLPAMKTWITQRVGWIDDQLVAPPSLIAGSTTLTFTPAPGTQLAYTVDGSDPRSRGGKLAPNAKLTSAPLTVPSATNVHVRSYRADREGVFPGSPWSSAAAGPKSSPLTPVARLVNLSARAAVGTGENVLIAGIVVADTSQKNYLVRGVGPTLGVFGVPGTLADPELSIRRADGTEIYKNTGWRTGPDVAALPATSLALGAFAFAATSADSALLPQLTAGAYTVRVSSASGNTGVALAELYETGTAGRTSNLSVRVQVQPGDGALIGGFVIQGPAYKRVLVRGIGPTLQAFGLTAALTDPLLTLYAGQAIVATNDAWSSGPDTAALVAATATVGAFALAPGTEDAALLITLPPGAYTAKIEGKNAATGVALLEIYEVP
jgi:hypothetical protein